MQQSDTCRLAQLRCHTAVEGHIYSKFTWGNRKSLVELPAAAGIDVRSQLLQYYRQAHTRSVSAGVSALGAVWSGSCWE